MYALLGLALALAAFLCVNAAVSLVVAGVAPAVIHRASRGRPLRRSRLLLGLRFLPSLVASGLVLGAFAPAYLVFEPQGAAEVPGRLLATLACGALVVLGAGCRRGLASWRGTRRLTGAWMRDAAPVDLPGAAATAYRVRDAFPVVSLVGLLRPRIFVARQVLDSLSPAEVAAAVAHETAHLRFRDNLKRLAMRSCPDVLAFLPQGRQLERAWVQASEAAADVQAAGGDPRRALDLGAALVKVARLVPPAARPAWSVSALHDGDEVAARVGRLLGAVPIPEPADGLSSVLGGAALLVLLLSLAQALGALGLVHRLTEAAVLFLR